MKIRLLFAWYDLWIGIFIDRQKDMLYILPVPMLGIVITLNKKECVSCKEKKYRYEMSNYECCKECDMAGYYH